MRKTFTFKEWLVAVRPQSLVASVGPVLVGSAMAFGDGIAHLPTAALCLCGAICFHLVTNLSNDVGDFAHEVDSKSNLGSRSAFLPDMIQSGRIMAAIIFFTAVSMGVSVLLIRRAGWPIAVIAVCSLFFALFYTIGKRPLGYQGWGELLVLAFFGPVACAGTYYVQSFEVNWIVVLAGLGPGLLSVGVLVANNLRDRENDRVHGKNTLVVKWGQSFGEWEYVFSVITACLLPTLLFVLMGDHQPILVCNVCVFFALPAVKTILTKHDYASYDKALAATGKLIVLYSALFSFAWIL